MHLLLLKGFTVFSKPLGDVMAKSLSYLSPFCVEVQSKKGTWSGFGIGPNLVTTTHLLGDETELDVTFFNNFGATAFLSAKDDMIGLFSLASHPKQPDIQAPKHLELVKEQPLFILGNFLGLRRSITRAVISDIIEGDYPSEARMCHTDTYSTGSPCFDRHGSLVGMLLGYVDPTNAGIAVTYITHEGQLVLT